MSDIDKLTVIDRDLVENIKSIILSSRKSLSQRVNQELIFTYWRIGKEIVDTEQKNNLDNQSSRQIILNLSKLLTKEIGKGFSRSNLFNMRKLYTEYPDVQSLTGHLTWTHFCELLIIEDKAKRSFYEKETVNSNWSIRELKRQIDSSLYERLLLSKGSKNKEKVLELARKGQEITNADDILKIRMFLNFLEFLRISQF
jgi:predicted nuclease of restriction endonuclease-like (RecB) superfamily